MGTESTGGQAIRKKIQVLLKSCGTTLSKSAQAVTPKKVELVDFGGNLAVNDAIKKTRTTA